MTDVQQQAFIRFITSHRIVSFHHGDCIGADEQAHALVQRHQPQTEIYIHPCTITNKRAYCKGATSVFSARPPLVRNQIIVDISTKMIATPKESEEILRSGTWATIRRAWKKFGKKNVIIIPPEGLEQLW